MDHEEKANIELEARQKGLGTLSEIELNYIESEIEYAIAAKSKSVNEGQVIEHLDISENFARDDSSSEQRKKDIINFIFEILDMIII